MNYNDLTDVLADAEGKSLVNEPVSRRAFIKMSGVIGGGLALGWLTSYTDRSLAATTGSDATISRLNAYIEIPVEGPIILYAKNPEVGQGVKTSLPMILAEELGADWQDIQVRQAEINESLYGPQFAGGSRSVPQNWDTLRNAGATARMMLISAAARLWAVPVEECHAAHSHVLHDPSKRSSSFQQLSKLAALEPVPDPAQIKLKSLNETQLLGKRITGVDNHALVTGQALFGIDQSLPGMKYAIYEKCPATGGKVRQANLEQVRNLPGVVDAFILRGNDNPAELLDGVAIIADSTWAAFKARKSLRIEWDETDAAKDSWTELVAEAKSLANADAPQTILSAGNVNDSFADANNLVESFYTYQFASHATLEPQNTTAWFHDGIIELWAPTQTPGRGITNVANVLGLDSQNVVVHQTRGGGGFGRRLINDPMCEAAAIAKRAGIPVKLQWSREDDMTHDAYRPGGFHGLKGGLDKSGRLIALKDHFITFSHDGNKPVSGGDMSSREFPAGLINNLEYKQTLLHFKIPCGPWRAPRSNTLAWVMQSFMHELSHAAGRDHVEFLLETLGEPRWLEPGNIGSLNTGRASAVIKLAAEKAGWGKELAQGRGMGLAFYFSHAGHIAEIADVSVDSNKRLTIHAVTVVADVGPIINLSGAENQCQGSVIDGLSTMMEQEITMEQGRVQQTNFNQYRLLRMPQTPPVSVHFIQTDNLPTGLGEPALPPLAPAICNAIFAATGHRVKTLPLAREGFYL